MSVITNKQKSILESGLKLLYDIHQNIDSLDSFINRMIEIEKSFLEKYGIKEVTLLGSLIDAVKSSGDRFKTTDDIELFFDETVYARLMKNERIRREFRATAEDIVEGFTGEVRRMMNFFTKSIIKPASGNKSSAISDIIISNYGTKLTLQFLYPSFKMIFSLSGAESILLNPELFIDNIGRIVEIFKRVYDMALASRSAGIEGGTKLSIDLSGLSKKIQEFAMSVKKPILMKAAQSVKLFTITMIASMYFIHRILADYDGPKFGGTCGCVKTLLEKS